MGILKGYEEVREQLTRAAVNSIQQLGLRCRLYWARGLLQWMRDSRPETAGSEVTFENGATMEVKIFVEIEPQDDSCGLFFYPFAAPAILIR